MVEIECPNCDSIEFRKEDEKPDRIIFTCWGCGDNLKLWKR